MKTHTFADVLSSLCRDQKSWGLYLSGVSTDVDALRAATGGTLEIYALIELMGRGELHVTFDTEEEMRAVFNSVVGDDGPTATNPYDGPCREYAEAAESLLEDVGVSLDPTARTLLERVREGTDAVSYLDEEGIHELAVTLLARDLEEARRVYGDP